MFEYLKLKKELQEQREIVENLTRLVKNRDLDWDDMRARCKRLLDRTEKAAARVVESEQVAEGEGELETLAGQRDAPGFALSPRQIQAQHSILARRRNSGLLHG